MIETIRIYNINKLEEKTDSEVLRELARKTYSNCRKITTEETYETEEGAKFYASDKFQLGKLQDILLECAEILKRKISYKPQKEELNKIIQDLTTGSEDYYRAVLIEDVINDVAYQYFKEDEAILDEHYEEPVFHMEYIIKKFKQMVNTICRILETNELKNHLGYSIRLFRNG